MGKNVLSIMLVIFILLGSIQISIADEKDNRTDVGEGTVDVLSDIRHGNLNKSEFSGNIDFGTTYSFWSPGLEDEKIFDINLEETEMDINSNNIFLLYSDGLTEAMNRSKEEYGTERVLNIIKENLDHSSKFIQSKLINSVDVFRENTEQNDDITFVVVKVK